MEKENNTQKNGEKSPEENYRPRAGGLVCLMVGGALVVTYVTGCGRDVTAHDPGYSEAVLSLRADSVSGDYAEFKAKTTVPTPLTVRRYMARVPFVDSLPIDSLAEEKEDYMHDSTWIIFKDLDSGEHKVVISNGYDSAFAIATISNLARIPIDSLDSLSLDTNLIEPVDSGQGDTLYDVDTSGISMGDSLTLPDTLTDSADSNQATFKRKAQPKEQQLETRVKQNYHNNPKRIAMPFDRRKQYARRRV